MTWHSAARTGPAARGGAPHLPADEAERQAATHEVCASAIDDPGERVGLHGCVPITQSSLIGFARPHFHQSIASLHAPTDRRGARAWPARCTVLQCAYSLATTTGHAQTRPRNTTPADRQLPDTCAYPRRVRVEETRDGFLDMPHRECRMAAAWPTWLSRPDAAGASVGKVQWRAICRRSQICRITGGMQQFGLV